MKILSIRKADLTHVDEIKSGEMQKAVLRQVRRKLLAAFDVYKSNVYYGVINESEGERQEIIKWYKRILDLDVQSISAPPNKVRAYL